ncbi:MAG TPA: hypothetical protein VIR60_03290 [Gammaproteobacteria bacterium]
MNTTSFEDVGVIESVQTGWMTKLPALLRILGAGALIVAMYGFLVRGWQSGNDVSRYLMLLGHTGLLAAIGLASGHWLKEAKGARLLVTLALVSVPVNFAILGAFIFSQTAGVELAYYPQYVAWSVDSLSTALLTAGGALWVLVPITLLGFTVLVRSLSRPLSGLFLVSNAVLLLPLRDPQAIAVVAGVLAIGVLMFSRKAAEHQTAAKTQEGITALGLQLLPLGVLLGRSLWLYAFDLFLATVLAATVFFTLRQVSLYLQSGSRLRNLLDAASLIPALWLMPLLGRAVFQTGMIPDAWVIPLGTVVSALLVQDIARRSTAYVMQYQRLAMGILLLGLIGNLLLCSETLAALACVGVGIAAMLYGHHLRQLTLFGGGALLVVVGLLHQALDLIRHFDLGSWISLAVIGVVAIVAASILESQSRTLRLRFEAWRGQLKEWRL